MSRSSSTADRRDKNKTAELQEDTSIPSGIPELTETAMVTIAAILNLFRLAGAELVLLQPGSTTERFEQAVRTKIDQFPGPRTSQSAHDAGLAFARHLVEQVLTQIRAQAEVKRSLTPAESSAHPPGHDAQSTTAIPRLLN
jgi:hypothetical protein